MGQPARLHWIAGRRATIIGAVAALSLALPAAGLAAGTPEFLFNFPAGHGYTLLGTANTEGGRTGVSFQLDKIKLQDHNAEYLSQTYGFDGFTGTYSTNSSHTHATLNANLGSYGSVSLTFSAVKPAKVLTITCPGSNKKTKIDKGVELGTATGSLSFNTQTSYFGTITGHTSKNSELAPLTAFLARREASDPEASAASTSTGILACLPPLKGKLTYLTLPAQGATGLATSTNTFFAARLGKDTVLSASDLNVSLTGGPETSRTIAADVLGGSAGNGLYSFASNLSKATAKAFGPFLSGSVSYSETQACSNTTGTTFGSTTGGITAKFDSGGYVTYGGPGTVGEMDKLPGPACDNPPTGAPG
jgi:hypothetical protein